MGVKNHAAPESEDEVVEVTFGDEAGQSTPNRDKKTDSTRSLASQVMSRLTPAQVEYYIASDITAIVEHTKYAGTNGSQSSLSFWPSNVIVCLNL
jgi:hypothetical protein